MTEPRIRRRYWDDTYTQWCTMFLKTPFDEPRCFLLFEYPSHLVCFILTIFALQPFQYIVSLHAHFRSLSRVAATQLPFHKAAEGTIRIGR